MPTIAPGVFDGEEPAGVGRDLRRVVGEEARRGGEAHAHHERRREDDEEDRAEDRPEGLERLRRVELAGLADDEDEARDRDHGDDDLGDREEQDRPRDPRPDDRVGRRAEHEPDQEDREDRAEDVGRVAGPRRQQPGPEGLVAEGRQAGDERDEQGQLGARAPPSARAGVAAAGPTGRGRAADVDGRRRGAARPRPRTPSAAGRSAARRRRRSPSTAAPTSSVPVRPSSSIRKKPAAIVPRIAPKRVRRVEPGERPRQVLVGR